MNCIVCKEPMIVLELDQVEIDYCLECKGIWLDVGELELLLEDPDRAKEIIRHLAETGEAKPVKRKCPICRKKMDEVPVGDKKTPIDRCRNDHGLWFDRGELKEIIFALDGQSSKAARLLQDIFRE